VPAGLIEQYDRMRAGSDLGGDFIEMELHALAVAGGQHQGGTGPKFRADRSEQIGRLRALIVHGARAGARPGPAIGQLVLLADPHLVLAPHFYCSAGRKLRADFRHAGGKVFLNAAMASGSCL
jgi:hypothetical protein